jgi:hypothetical protein
MNFKKFMKKSDKLQKILNNEIQSYNRCVVTQLNPPNTENAPVRKGLDQGRIFNNSAACSPTNSVESSKRSNNSFLAVGKSPFEQQMFFK